MMVADKSSKSKVLLYTAPIRVLLYSVVAFLLLYSWRISEISGTEIVKVVAVCTLMGLVPIVVTWMLKMWSENNA